MTTQAWNDAGDEAGARLLHRDAADCIDLSRNLPPPLGAGFQAVMDAALTTLRTQVPIDLVFARHRLAGAKADREAGAQFSARRLGQAPSPNCVVVTSGVQAALIVLFSRLARQDAVLGVEELSYPAIQALAGAVGLKTVPLGMDEAGVLPEALRRAAREQGVKAIYLIPTLQNPTAIIMPMARRLEVIETARHAGLTIIEDDIYSVLPSSAPPPLAALAPDLCWYLVGTAKCMTPGLRVAYATAPSEADASALFWPANRTTYWMAAPLNAALATMLIESGAAQDVIASVRNEVEARRSIAEAALGALSPTIAPGALHLWLKLPQGAEEAAVVDAAAARGVVVGAGRSHAFDGVERRGALRIGVGSPHDRAALARGLDVVAEEISRLAEAATPLEAQP